MQARHRSYVKPSTNRVAKGAHTHTLTSCESVDYETGTVTFKNGQVVSADLIVGADGIRVNTCSINSDYSSLKPCFQVYCSQTDWDYPEHPRGSTGLLQV